MELGPVLKVILGTPEHLDPKEIEGHKVNNHAHADTKHWLNPFRLTLSR